MFNKAVEFYNGKAWKLVKRQAIDRATGPDGFVYDEISGEKIVKKGDIIVHHVVELTDENVDDFSVSLNLDNLRVVSFDHHNQIHNRFGASLEKKVVWVYGDDFDTMQQFVDDHATDFDMIVDVNRIRRGITRNGVRTKATDRAVFIVRDALLDAVVTRQGAWQTCWIITRELDSRMATRIGCTLLEFSSDNTPLHTPC